MVLREEEGYKEGTTGRMPSASPDVYANNTRARARRSDKHTCESFPPQVHRKFVNRTRLHRFFKLFSPSRANVTFLCIRIYVCVCVCV